MKIVGHEVTVPLTEEEFKAFEMILNANFSFTDNATYDQTTGKATFTQSPDPLAKAFFTAGWGTFAKHDSWAAPNTTLAQFNCIPYYVNRADAENTELTQQLIGCAILWLCAERESGLTKSSYEDVVVTLVDEYDIHVTMPRLPSDKQIDWANSFLKWIISDKPSTITVRDFDGGTVILPLPEVKMVRPPDVLTTLVLGNLEDPIAFWNAQRDSAKGEIAEYLRTTLPSAFLAPLLPALILVYPDMPDDVKMIAQIQVKGFSRITASNEISSFYKSLGINEPSDGWSSMIIKLLDEFDRRYKGERVIHSGQPTSRLFRMNDED